MKPPRPSALMLCAVLLVALLPAAAPSPVHAEPPLAAGTVFDPASGVPRGQWEAFFDANEPGRYLVWWDTPANQARVAFPCAVAPDGQLILEFVLYQFGAPQENGENSGGGPRRPTVRNPSYEIPTPLLSSLDGWSPLVSGRLVLDPRRTRASTFFGGQLWTHRWTEAGQWASLFPDGNVPASAWIDEGFTQISSPLFWPPATTVNSLPPEGFPFTENSPHFDPFVRLMPSTRTCATDPLPRAILSSGAASVSGLVRNATTGQGLAGATVSGGNRVATTGPDGAFTLTELPTGLVPVTASLDGYIPDSVELNLAADRVSNQVFALSPSLLAGQQLRVVLTWGESPQDLDAHVWIPTGNGGTIEVFYGNPGALSGPPFAALDVDDRNGRGPETVTIGQLPEGRCIYAIHNYSGEAPFAAGGARVQVIQGSSVIQSFTPPSGSGGWWYVFTFDCVSGEITAVNQVGDKPPDPSQPLAPGQPTAVPTSAPSPPPTSPSASGRGVAGLVRNATNGQPISGASVSGGGGNTTSGSDGRFQLLELPAGPIQLTASASGFITDTASVTVPETGTVTQTFALSPELAVGQVRIILTWGDTPRDLDAHLWVPAAEGTSEISYASPGSLIGPPFATLDVDDRDSFGPETITTGQLPDGRCVYAVHNYSGDTPIPSSGARVQVIQGSSVVQTFTPPAGSGGWWHVLSFDCSTGSLTQVNTLSDSPPSVTFGAPAATATVPAGSSGVEGIVRNAANGQPVANATVSAGGRTATTDPAGRYQIAGLDPGPATVSVSASGFITDTATVTIPASGFANQTFALSQALAEGQLRIVLTWGTAPLDLDAYLFVPTEVGFTQVYYGDAGSTSTMPFAALDVDDRNGLGPETITIARLGTGTYTYSVNNFSGEASLSSSGARVQVIQGSSVVQTFTLPSGTGTWWNLFTIDGATGVLTPLNRISDRGR